MNCFGKLSVLTGHNLDPEPPHRMTGQILTQLFIILFINIVYNIS